MDTETHHHDVVVIGGGAAGLSAALVLGRARRRVAVIDAGEPRNAPAAHMQGFLSRDGMPPADLLAVARTELRTYGIELIDDSVAAVTRAPVPGLFALQLAGGSTLLARRLLLATGATDAVPAIPGARERWGRDLLHCPYCHGWEVRDRPLAVLATGPESVEYAHLLRQWSADLVLLANGLAVSGPEREGLARRGIRVVDGTVARLAVTDDRLEAVVLADGTAVRREAVFVRPSLRPRGGELLEALAVEVDEGGFARVDGTGRTSAAGVWAAGNVANPRAQVITAAGEGSAAAIAINADLVQEDAR